MKEFKIITGGKGSGKTRKCIEAIKAVRAADSDARCIMLVNEHYSYEMEKQFIDEFGGTGLNGVEVKTFRRLANDVLGDGKYMTAAGRQILLGRTVKRFLAHAAPKNRPHADVEDVMYIDEKLYSSIGKQGFLDVLAAVIKEMKSYGISPEELHGMAEHIRDNDALAEKLAVIAGIYELYSTLFDEIGCIDTDDTYDELARAIREESVLDGIYLWIDKFDELLPQQMRVINALCIKAEAVTVSVCYPENENERPLYEQVRHTLEKIEGLGSAERFDCGKHLKTVKNSDLFFFLDSFASRKKYDEKPESICLMQSRDMYGEVKFCANEILKLIFDKGMRFRDISVMCGGEGDYTQLVKTVFDEYDIPYFSDSSIALSHHPAAEQVLSLFEMFENKFDIESVFRYLRAGYVYLLADGVPVNIQGFAADGTDVDELENYAVKFGINGEKRWLDAKWKSEKSFVDSALENEPEETDIESIAALRDILMRPVKRYRAKTRGRKSAEVHAKALFEWLLDINMYEGLNEDIKKLCVNPDDEKSITDARMLEKLWNLLIMLLEQLVAALGDDKLSRREFADYLRAAVEKCEIRMIPSGIDRVYVGTAENSSSADVRVMFMLGANEGAYPAEITSEGFLSDADRNSINSTFTKNIAPDTSVNMDKRRFSIWSAMAKTTEKLYISRAVCASDGREQTPARLFLQAENKFPKLRIISDRDISEEVTTPKATLHEMLIHKSKASREQNPFWDAVFECLRDEKYGVSRESGLWEKADAYTDARTMISPRLAELLYGSRAVYSASRLNIYAGCPFKYFMSCGLWLKPREEYEIAANDIGTYAHSVIEQFCRTVEDGAQTSGEKLERWQKLPEKPGEEKCRDEIIDEIIDKTIENIDNDEIYKKEHIKSIFARTGKVIKRAAKTVHNSLKYGKYTIASEENDLTLRLSGEVAVRGRVDRIDEYSPEDRNKRIRIIDYKTGKTEFNLRHIYNGLDMQLVIYAIMARERFGTDGVPADVSGMYYNFVKASGYRKKRTYTDEQAKNAIRKSMLLNGITFVDNMEELETIDKNYLDESDVININYTSNHKITPGLNALIRNSEDSVCLMDFVREKILAMDAEIRKCGSIKRNPKKDSSVNACDYCDYSEICALDGDKEEDAMKQTAKQVWEEIKGE